MLNVGLSLGLQVRLRELTEENLDEWLFRVSFWDEIHCSHERIRQSRNRLEGRLKRWLGMQTNGYYGLKGFSDEEATQCGADHGLASAG